MEKRTLAYVLFAVIAVGAVFVVITNKPKVILPNENQNQNEVQNNLNILKKTERSINKETTRMSIEVAYPEYENVPANINFVLKKFAEDEVANIEELKLEEVPTSSSASYFLKITYEVEQANTDYLSLVYNVGIYTGGAHSNQYFKAYNFNTKTGDEVKLSDLYPAESSEGSILEILKPKIKVAVHEYLVKFFNNQGDSETDPDSLLFQDINSLGSEYFQNFNFSNTYIKFFFSPYDLAPYVVGPITALVSR